MSPSWTLRRTRMPASLECTMVMEVLLSARCVHASSVFCNLSTSFPKVSELPGTPASIATKGWSRTPSSHRATTAPLSRTVSLALTRTFKKVKSVSISSALSISHISFLLPRPELRERDLWLHRSHAAYDQGQ